MSLLEGVWARGDRKLGRALQAAHHRGCRFDGWGDQLKFNRWLDAFAETGIDPEFFTLRRRELNEPLPWDHIDIRISKKHLQTEWVNALNSTVTADCRETGCNNCGSCDFERVKPMIQHLELVSRMSTAPAPAVNSFTMAKKIQVHYSKTGPARFFGHLEMVNVFLRALRRAGIPLKYSDGFHPKPKVSFDNPLPTGFESEDERLVVAVAGEIILSELRDRLNAQLPKGLYIHECSETITPRPSYSRFRVFFDPPIPEAFRKESFQVDMDQDLSFSSNKGKLKKITVKDIVKNIYSVEPGCLEITLCTEPEKSMRPSELLTHLFQLSENEIQNARFIKLKNHSN
jgi:radical SAM-linked protein